jgi:hypothetical protein
LNPAEDAIHDELLCLRIDVRDRRLNVSKFQVGSWLQAFSLKPLTKKPWVDIAHGLSSAGFKIIGMEVRARIHFLCFCTISKLSSYPSHPDYGKVIYLKFFKKSIGS